MFAGLAESVVINADFNAYEANTNPSRVGIPYSGQGAFGDAGNDYWNILTFEKRTAIDLLTSDGSIVTTIDVNIDGGNGYIDLAKTNYLLSDYFYNATTTTITGLDPDAGYFVYVYAAGDVAGQGSTITIGTEVQGTSGLQGDGFVLGGNYVIFEATADATGQIVIESSAKINGFQIVEGEQATLPDEGGFSNLTADINDDGVVNHADLAKIVTWWSSHQCPALSNCMGTDINTDGVVDFKDFAEVSVQWLKELSEPRTVEVDVQADTYLASGSEATVNFGSSVTLKTTNSNAVEIQTLLRFDLPEISISPDSAFIWIHTPAEQTDPVENAAYLVADDSWLEHTVNWNTKPAANQELDAWVTDNDRAIKIDVTDQVIETLQGDGRLSIMIQSPHNIGSDGQSLYYSKEAGSGLSPTLVMSFNQPKAYVQPGQSIQQAINTIHSQGGGQVILLSGEHFINNSLTLYSDITLRGQGKENTSILMSQACNEPLCIGTSEGTVNSDITIADLTLNALLNPDQQQYPPSYHSDPPPDLDIRKDVIGILFTDQDSGNTFERIRFENVSVTRCSMGIHVKGVDDLRIFNSDINGNGSIIGYYHNIYFRRANNTLLKNLNLSNCTAGNGFNLSTNCNNLIIDNCDASDNNFRGIRFEANDGGSRQMVINCTADRNGLTEGQPGIRIANVPDFTILGCTANGNGDNGFYCVGSSNGLIKGNTAINNADTDYYLQRCNTVEVRNNTGGTYRTSSSSNITMTGNDFE